MDAIIKVGLPALTALLAVHMVWTTIVIPTIRASVEEIEEIGETGHVAQIGYTE